MKTRLIPFRWLPSNWNLHGDALAEAEARYYLEGEALERRLLDFRYKNEPKALAKALLDLDRRYAHLDQYGHDVKLAELENSDELTLRLRLIEIDLLYQKCTPHEAARCKVMVQTKSGIEREVALLDVEYNFHRLSKHDFEKQRANLRGEPWIAIINSGLDIEKGLDGVFFEFDWNDKWIDVLRKNGYLGHSDDQLVDEWFSDVCRSHTAAELAGSLAPSHHLHP